MQEGDIFLSIVLLVFAVIFVSRVVRVVPQQQAFVVERLGKYHRTLNAGWHFVIPIVDSVRYKHGLKEIVLDIPPQVCITKDNVQVDVDGILFFRVLDPVKASYGVADYVVGLVQLAQTSLRSEIGKIDLDKTFEERGKINVEVVGAIDRASDPWGVKVLRYEIKSITPPRDVLAAMEKQMRAEREKRASILQSEGERDSKINVAEGNKQEVIKQSEAERQKKINEADGAAYATVKKSEADQARQINEARGQGEAILSIASATANGLKQIADSLKYNGGMEAATLKIAEEYIKQFGQIAKESNTMIIPANTADIGAMMATATALFDKTKKSA
jgi:regulator of protease activity HflC (stomatin/prohibitin superfamily)